MKNIRRKRSDREKLYESLDGHGRVEIRVNFSPLLLAALGYFNCLEEKDRPNLDEVESVKASLRAHGAI